MTYMRFNFTVLFDLFEEKVYVPYADIFLMPIFTTNLIFSTRFNENIGIILYHVVVKTS